MPLSNELKLLHHAPLSFMKTYWVVPGSGYGMKRGGLNPYLPLERVLAGQLRTTDSLLTITGNRDKVAYAELVREAGDKYKLNFYSHRQCAEEERENYLPIWFLPWFSDHVTKVKILQRGLLPPNVPDPNLFFTSALSGCSVFVQGPANSPTVFHGGFSNTRDFVAQPRVANPQTGRESDSLQHWRLLFGRYGGGGGGFAEVNKEHYLSGGGNYEALTPDMQVYKQFLEQEHRQQLRIMDMKSEGTVFGIRDQGGDWTFYLQESVTVDVFLLRKTKFRKRLVDGERKTYTRPMVIKKIFPAQGNAITWNLTRILD